MQPVRGPTIAVAKTDIQSRIKIWGVVCGLFSTRHQNGNFQLDERVAQRLAFWDSQGVPKENGETSH